MAASASNEASTAVVEDATVRPFRVEVSQVDLDDLRRRIALVALALPGAGHRSLAGRAAAEGD